MHILKCTALRSFSGSSFSHHEVFQALDIASLSPISPIWNEKHVYEFSFFWCLFLRGLYNWYILIGSCTQLSRSSAEKSGNYSFHYFILERLTCKFFVRVIYIYIFIFSVSLLFIKIKYGLLTTRFAVKRPNLEMHKKFVLGDDYFGRTEWIFREYFVYCRF